MQLTENQLICPLRHKFLGVDWRPSSLRRENSISRKMFELCLGYFVLQKMRILVKLWKSVGAATKIAPLQVPLCARESADSAT
jgi:hypothetical protein